MMVPVRVFSLESEALDWVVSAQAYHQGYRELEAIRRSTMTRPDKFLPLFAEWVEFVDDWRHSHPAGHEASYCDTFSYRQMEAFCSPGSIINLPCNSLWSKLLLWNFP